jgi:hypothetical protein
VRNSLGDSTPLNSSESGIGRSPRELRLQTCGHQGSTSGETYDAVHLRSVISERLLKFSRTSSPRSRSTSVIPQNQSLKLRKPICTDPTNRFGWRFRRQAMPPNSSEPIWPKQEPTQSLRYGQLRLHPFWDLVRGDPCLARIVALLAPEDSSPQARRT